MSKKLHELTEEELAEASVSVVPPDLDTGELDCESADDERDSLE